MSRHNTNTLTSEQFAVLMQASVILFGIQEDELARSLVSVAATRGSRGLTAPVRSRTLEVIYEEEEPALPRSRPTPPPSRPMSPRSVPRYTPEPQPLSRSRRSRGFDDLSNDVYMSSRPRSPFTVYSSEAPSQRSPPPRSPPASKSPELPRGYYSEIGR